MHITFDITCHGCDRIHSNFSLPKTTTLNWEDFSQPGKSLNEALRLSSHYAGDFHQLSESATEFEMLLLPFFRSSPAVRLSGSRASLQVGPMGRVHLSAPCGWFPMSPADLHSGFTCKVLWDDPAAHSQRRPWDSSIASSTEGSHQGQLPQTRWLWLQHQELPLIRCG